MAEQLQGIFYTKQDGQWLYTVRWPVIDRDDAIARTKELSGRYKAPAKVKVEDWNFPRSDIDGFVYSTEDPEPSPPIQILRVHSTDNRDRTTTTLLLKEVVGEEVIATVDVDPVALFLNMIEQYNLPSHVQVGCKNMVMEILNDLDVHGEPDVPADIQYEAYMEGQADFLEGKYESDCPYRDGHELKDEWLRGFETARQQTE